MTDNIDMCAGRVTVAGAGDAHNPVAAWVSSLPDLPTDPTRRAMVIALAAVEEEIERSRLDPISAARDEIMTFPHLFAARIALTDALFPPPPRAKEPVPEWFMQNLREKQRLCAVAWRSQNHGPMVADRALAQDQLLDELLQQAMEVSP